MRHLFCAFTYTLFTLHTSLIQQRSIGSNCSGPPSCPHFPTLLHQNTRPPSQDLVWLVMVQSQRMVAISSIGATRNVDDLLGVVGIWNWNSNCRHSRTNTTGCELCTLQFTCSCVHGNFCGLILHIQYMLLLQGIVGVCVCVCLCGDGDGLVDMCIDKFRMMSCQSFNFFIAFWFYTAWHTVKPPKAEADTLPGADKASGSDWKSHMYNTLPNPISIIHYQPPRSDHL